MNDIYLQLISDIREYSMQLFLVEHIYFSYMQVGPQYDVLALTRREKQVYALFALDNKNTFSDISNNAEVSVVLFSVVRFQGCPH